MIWAFLCKFLVANELVILLFWGVSTFVLMKETMASINIPHNQAGKVCDLSMQAHRWAKLIAGHFCDFLKEIIKQKIPFEWGDWKFDQSNSEVGRLISRLFWYCFYASLVSMHKCLLIGRWEVGQVICQHIWFWWPESQLKFHQTSTVIHENNGKTESSWVSLQSCMK